MANEKYIRQDTLEFVDATYHDITSKVLNQHDANTKTLNYKVYRAGNLVQITGIIELNNTIPAQSIYNGLTRLPHPIGGEYIVSYTPRQLNREFYFDDAIQLELVEDLSTHYTYLYITGGVANGIYNFSLLYATDDDME